MRRLEFGLVITLALWPLGDASANSNLVTESVSNYSGNGDIPNAIPNCWGFRSGMTGWTTLYNYMDSSVYDTDFGDPQIRTGGGDTSNFGPSGSGAAISYFCGHGTCDAGFPGGCAGGSVQVCQHASDCPA